MSFVVQHHERGTAVEFTQHAPCKSVRCLLAFVDNIVGLPTFVMRRLQRELMPIGNQHLPFIQQRTQFRRDKREFIVVVVHSFRTQDLEALLNCQVWTDNQRGGREPFVGRHFAAVAKRPGDEHRHHHSLAAACRHFAAVADKLLQARRIRRVYQFAEFRRTESRFKPRPSVAAENLNEVDNRLNRFALTEKQPMLQIIACPMPQQLARDRRNVRVIRLPPPFHIGAEFVDYRQIIAFFLLDELHLPLFAAGAFCFEPVSRLASAGILDSFAGLGIVYPVRVRFFVGAAQDGLFNWLNRDFKLIFVHNGCIPPQRVLNSSVSLSLARRGSSVL